MKPKNKHMLLALLAITLFYGCKKDSTLKAPNSLDSKITTANSIPDSMTMTPFGLVPKSSVHLVEDGYQLEIRDGHMLKVSMANGNIKEDFGAIKSNATSGVNQSTQNQTLNQNTTLSNKPNSTAHSFDYFTNEQYNWWDTYAEWSNTNSDPINGFSNTVTVPINPSSIMNRQIIQIENGIESAQVYSSFNNIFIQTVLEWGGIDGSYTQRQYWTVNNWCSWGNGYARTDYQTVYSNDIIKNNINLIGQQADGSYNYSASFTVNGKIGNTLNIIEGITYPNTYTIIKIPKLTWAYEVLASYLTNTLQDYPAQASVNFKNIKITTGSVNNLNPANLTWTSKISVLPHNYSPRTNLGEHTNIISNDPNGNGEVDLWFHSEAPSISYSANSYTLPTGTNITPITPKNTGSAPLAYSNTTYSISPTLPQGLSLNPTTGTISGTPTIGTSNTQYIVTASTNGGTSTFSLFIQILAPPVFSYPTPNVFTVGTTINALAPTNTGGAPNSYSISPTLPAGLSFNPGPGVISGTPSAASTATNYTITGTNAAGSFSYVTSITVNNSNSFTFGIVTNYNSPSWFYMIVNGANISGPRGTAAQGQVNNIICASNRTSNSTVVMQITSGHIPTSATLYPQNAAPINAVISGNNVTFNNVNLLSTSSATLVIY